LTRDPVKKNRFFLQGICLVRTTTDITSLLTAATAGRHNATERLFPLVYDELRALAAWSLRHERSDHTLQATALVHEVYIRLTGHDHAAWQDRAHFFAVAAQAVRRILVDHARSKNRRKRGGGAQRVPLDGIVLIAPEHDFDMVALDRCMTALAAPHPRKACVVELRFFGGLTVEEVGRVLGVGTRTVERDWEFARAWIFRKLCEEDHSHTAGGTQ